MCFVSFCCLPLRVFFSPFSESLCGFSVGLAAVLHVSVPLCLPPSPHSATQRTGQTQGGPYSLCTAGLREPLMTGSLGAGERASQTSVALKLGPVRSFPKPAARSCRAGLPLPATPLGEHCPGPTCQPWPRGGGIREVSRPKEGAQGFLQPDLFSEYWRMGQSPGAHHPLVRLCACQVSREGCWSEPWGRSMVRVS